ncbi:MAG: hypothetical protein HDS75_06550 [Bacteroidales bacterium]|nr:hypothetical protein [Bacteroidales bacterium]
MTEEVVTPAADASRQPNYLAIVGFILSLMSFSVGMFNLPWGVGLVGAIIGLGLSVLALFRGGRRLWAIVGIILSVFFLLLTLALSLALGLSLSTMMRL